MATMQLSGFKLFTKDKPILKIGLFSNSSLEKKRKYKTVSQEHKALCVFN